MKLNITEALPSLFAVNLLLTGLLGCATSAGNNTNSNPSTDTQTQQEVKIGGSSSTYPAMQILTDAYIAKVKTTKAVFTSPSQSEVAIAGVQEGIFDIAVVSKQLKPEESKGTLDYREVAKDGLLVATHPSVTSVKNLTTDNLKAIYSGRVKNWKQLGGSDAKIVLLDRPEDESAKKLLRQHYLGKNLKNTPEAVVLRKESDLIAAIQTTPHSIGAFSLASAISQKIPVNRLNLDNIEPTQENVRLGKYKMVRAIGLVTKKTPTEPVEAMLDFATSPEASAILNQTGFVASN